MMDFAPILVPVLSFAAVAALVIVAGHYVATQTRLQRRLPAAAVRGDIATDEGFQNLHAFVARRFDAKRFGIDGAVREKLRRDLLRAGYFRSYAVNYYILARV